MSLADLNGLRSAYDPLHTELSFCNGVLTCILIFRLLCKVSFYICITHQYSAAWAVLFLFISFLTSCQRYYNAVLHCLVRYFWKETVMRLPKVVYTHCVLISPRLPFLYADIFFNNVILVGSQGHPD